MMKTFVALLLTTATGAAPAVAAPPASESSAENAPAPVDGSDKSEITTLTLARALETAAAHQPSIQQARASTEAAAARIDQAAAVGLPQLTGTGTYQRTTGNFSPRPGATSAAVQMAPPWTTGTYNYFNFGATASQLIYDFGQTPERRRAAASTRDAAAAAERTAAFTVKLQVQQAFFRARAQRALTAVASAAVDNQGRHVDQIKGFVAAGLRPEIDLASVRTDLANARVQLITAQNGYGQAKAELNRAMGVFSPRPYEIADEELPPVEGEDSTADGLVQDALRRRPELTTLQYQQTAQQHLLRGLKGGYGPALTANAAATEAGTEMDHLVPNWLVGATLSWPLLQGGLTRGQVREAEANLRVLEAQTTALRLQVQLEIEEALLAVRASKASVQAVAEAVTSAQEQLRLAEGRYRTGLGNALELGDSQQALSAASAQAVQAQFNLAGARAQLSLALGRP
ncbi:MAG: TolC family protein [Myxococcales bacterium]